MAARLGAARLADDNSEGGGKRNATPVSDEERTTGFTQRSLSQSAGPLHWPAHPACCIQALPDKFDRLGVRLAIKILVQDLREYGTRRRDLREESHTGAEFEIVREPENLGSRNP